MWILLVIAAPLVLYGVHRLCLRLEERGYLYYKHRRPQPGGSSAFLLLQEICQPQISHVIAAEDHTLERAGDDRYLPGTPQPGPDQRPADNSGLARDNGSAGD